MTDLSGPMLQPNPISDMRSLFRGLGHEAESAERQSALAAIGLPLDDRPDIKRSRTGRRLVLFAAICFVAIVACVLGVVMWPTAPGRAIPAPWRAFAAIPVTRGPAAPRKVSSLGAARSRVAPDIRLAAQSDGGAGPGEAVEDRPAADRTGAGAGHRLSLARPAGREGCRPSRWAGGGHCRPGEVLAADSQLRAAYDRAAAMGMARPQLDAIRRRWAEVDARFADDPRYQIANYRTLARNLADMRAQR